MSDKELADKLEQLAADVLEYGREGAQDKWKYEVEYVIGTGHKLNFEDLFLNPSRYTRKPDTIDINGHTVELGMRKWPKSQQRVYVASPSRDNYSFMFMWSSNPDDEDIVWLERGLIHDNEESARKHGEALASFTRRGEWDG